MSPPPVSAPFTLLLAGAGRMGREVLKRLAEGWRVTLVDTSDDALKRAAGVFPGVTVVVSGDASSPVVLDKAGLAGHDYVLALTGDDQVNLAVSSFAREQGVPHVVSVVRDMDLLPAYEGLGVQAVRASAIVARELHQRFTNPGIRISPLAQGEAAVYEVDAADHFRVVGKRAAAFAEPGQRLVALLRSGRLLYPEPDTLIQTDDRLVILGRADTFQRFCDILECGQPHFPLAYGHGLLLALPGEDEAALSRLLEKARYLVRNTQVKTVVALCPEALCDLPAAAGEWPEGVDLRFKKLDGNLPQRIRELAAGGEFGLVVMPPPGPGRPWGLGKPVAASLAANLERPLLVSRFTLPYERILVAFDNSSLAELALDIAVDLARQLGSSVSAAVVEEPAFLSGEAEEKAAQRAAERVRELAHIHKTRIELIQRRGNPVREISALSSNYDLLMVGADNPSGGLLTPNQAEELARRAACSVLLIPG
ncbi:MAG: NAD-binding protein [Thermodesulfobacteriota bacterium]